MSTGPGKGTTRVSPLLSVLRQRRPPADVAPAGAPLPDEPADPRARDADLGADAGPAEMPDNVTRWFGGQASARRAPDKTPVLREVTGPVAADETARRIAEAPVRPLPGLPDPATRLAGRRARRQRQRWGILVSFLAFVAVPTLAAALYYGFIASDQYVSEVKFALRSVERNAGHDAASVVSGVPNALAGNTDSFIIADYVTTRQFVDEVQGKVDLRRIFSHPSADLWSRFNPAAPVEALVNHWRAMVMSRYDLSTGILTVKVRAYTPEDSFKLAQTVLDGSERLANELTNRGRQDFVRFAESEVQKAEARLRGARDALGNFRRTEGTYDPVRVATSNADLLAKLRSDLAGMRAEAAALAGSMQPNAPMIQALTGRIKATEQQVHSVEAEGQRNGQGLGGDMGSMVARYATLESEQTFAEKSYGMAMDALQAARGLADRQQIYLATFARPALAESAQFPNRPASTAVVAGFALLVWLTGLLVVLGVRDHMR
jgi:capsular polysaccharide transport system permease protein